jgi:mannose/fructose/N-acetylgalactosamine-specific phosphotransferase system component IIC
VSWILLVGLGAVVALDATSFGQLMLSRPLVAGTLAGAIVGQPLEGALVGATLEALSLGIMPVGAAKYPETGTAAVLAMGTLGLSGLALTPTAFLLTLVYGVLWQSLSGATVIAGRYINEWLVQAGRGVIAERMDRMIERRHVGAMILDLVRGVLVTTAGLGIGVPLLRQALPLWDLPAVVAAGAVAVAAVTVLAGNARIFADNRRGAMLLAAGLLCGSAFLFLR